MPSMYKIDVILSLVVQYQCASVYCIVVPRLGKVNSPILGIKRLHTQSWIPRKAALHAYVCRQRVPSDCQHRPQTQQYSKSGASGASLESQI